MRCITVLQEVAVRQSFHRPSIQTTQAFMLTFRDQTRNISLLKHIHRRSRVPSMTLFVFSQYNEELHYVEPCLNGTLVQADVTNKDVSTFLHLHLHLRLFFFFFNLNGGLCLELPQGILSILIVCDFMSVVNVSSSLSPAPPSL